MIYCRSGKYTTGCCINMVNRRTMNHADEMVRMDSDSQPASVRGTREWHIDPSRRVHPSNNDTRYVTSIFLDDSQTAPNPGFLLYELLELDSFPHARVTVSPLNCLYLAKPVLKRKKNACTSVDRYLRETAGIGKGKTKCGAAYSTNNIGTYCTRVLEYRMVLVLYGARTCARTIQRSVHRCAITSLRSASDHSREINRGHIRCLFSTEARKKEEKKERKGPN